LLRKVFKEFLRSEVKGEMGPYENQLTKKEERKENLKNG